MMGSLLSFAQSGGLDGALLTSKQFYQTDYTNPLLFMADGAVLENRAQQQHLLGTQWGMMNETGSYPGQVWLWLYTFWYQIKPFSTSANADVLVMALMGVLSLAFITDPIPPRRTRPPTTNPHLQADLARPLPNPASRTVPSVSTAADPQSFNGAIGPMRKSDQPSRLATEMLDLDRTECLRLLGTTGIGRIVVSVPEWDHPMIRPVNYLFDESSQSVLIRSALGSKLHALLRSAKAAFEIDGADAAGRVGWSVIIVGVSEEITNPAELRRIGSLGLEPWAPGHKGHWIRIRANTVSGRRIALVADHEAGLEMT